MTPYDLDPARIAFDPATGLVPAIVQSTEDGEVRMLGWMNRSALTRTLQTGRVTFFSRSRQELWVKGATSGNWLELVSISVDCDGDSLLLEVRPHGPTCHTGGTSCFVSRRSPVAVGMLDRLISRVDERLRDRPDGSYTVALAEAGTGRVAQKVGEEGVEVALAAVSAPERLAEESADLLYHLVLLWRSAGLDPQTVRTELEARERSSVSRATSSTRTPSDRDGSSTG